MVDCGEGTQRQLLRSGAGFRRLHRLLLTRPFRPRARHSRSLFHASASPKLGSDDNPWRKNHAGRGRAHARRALGRRAGAHSARARSAVRNPGIRRRRIRRRLLSGTPPRHRQFWIHIRGPCATASATLSSCGAWRPGVAGEGHWITGTFMMIAAYGCSLLFVERLFRIVRPKLLRLPWFARLWNWVLVVRAKVVEFFRPS
jgi:hypothetical protein